MRIIIIVTNNTSSKIILFCSSTDQEQLEQEINDLRKGLKEKVNRLNDLQGNQDIK